jgi:hypothetical protein
MLAGRDAAGYHFDSATSLMPQPPSKLQPPAPSGDVPATPPSERFWPYADLPEEPSAEELAALDPDLHEALFGRPPGPFSITLVFPPFAGEQYAKALELARASREYREVGAGDAKRHRATFYSTDAPALRDLFTIVGPLDSCEVLVDGRPVPHARELWLPLVWFLLPR